MRNSPRPFKDESGIALITALLMLMSFTAIGVFAINATIVNQDISANLKTSKQGFYLAEAGIQHAKRFLTNNSDNWSSYAYATATPLIAATQLSNIGTYTATVRDAGGGSLRVLSTGNTSSKGAAVIEALFNVIPSLFPCAVCAKGDITLSGGSTTDSFDSSVAPYSSATAGSQGSVKTNANVTLSGGSRVNGDATAVGTVSTSGGATVTGTTTNGAPPMTFPPVNSPCGTSFSSSTGITGGSYSSTTGDLKGSGGAAITLAAGTYCFHSVNLSGGSTLTVNGQVKIYVTDKSDFSGGTVANTTGLAENLQLFSSYVSSSQGITLSGGAQAYMAIYAPDARVKFSGGSDFYGAVIAGVDDDSGGIKIHYDKALKKLGGGGSVNMVTWRQVF